MKSIKSLVNNLSPNREKDGSKPKAKKKKTRPRRYPREGWKDGVPPEAPDPREEYELDDEPA